MPVRDIWLGDALNICTGLFMQVCSSPECVFFFFFIFHMKLSELFVFFVCSFLMKLDGFQTPESEICNASLFFLLLLFSFFSSLHFAYEPFRRLPAKNKKKETH